MKFKLLIIIAFGMLLNVAANTHAEYQRNGVYLTSLEILITHDGLEVNSFYFDNMEFMNLRVMDSEGNLISSERFRSASGRWSLPGHVSDGSYKYEVEIKLIDTTENTDPDDKTKNGMDTHRQIGTFDVIKGKMEPSEGLDPSGADISQLGLLQDVAQIAMNTAGYVLELLVPSAQAADIYIEDNSPALLYDDTADEGALTTTYDWSLYCDGGGANDDVNNFCRFYDKQFEDIVMELRSEGNSANSMMVLENGDITFGNGALFLDRSKGFFAIGTTSVQDEEFTLRASNPEIALQDSTDDSEMNLQYDLGEFAIEGNTEQDIVRIESTAPGNSMYIGTTGDIGIGTVTPVAMLHVVGGAVIDGDVALGSSRALKHELEAVPVEATLDDVLGLPLYHWKYKDDIRQASHVGPMAEDFYARFGLGRDDKHLSPADSSGLALAAIQGLNRRFEKQVVELLDANRRLGAENALLLKRLEAIEQALETEQQPEREAALQAADRISGEIAVAVSVQPKGEVAPVSR